MAFFQPDDCQGVRALPRACSHRSGRDGRSLCRRGSRARSTSRAEVSPAGDRGRAARFRGARGRGRSRLLREARAAAQLDHPFICKVYEVGEHDGRAFFAMEYVEGVTLNAHLASGRLTSDEAVRIGTEIAEALHFAHSRGRRAPRRQTRQRHAGRQRTRQGDGLRRRQARVGAILPRCRRPRARLRRPCRASPRARSPICHRSSFVASRSTPVPTSSRSACCSTNC